MHAANGDAQQCRCVLHSQVAPVGCLQRPRQCEWLALQGSQSCCGRHSAHCRVCRCVPPWCCLFGQPLYCRSAPLAAYMPVTDGNLLSSGVSGAAGWEQCCYGWMYAAYITAHLKCIVAACYVSGCNACCQHYACTRRRCTMLVVLLLLTGRICGLIVFIFFY